jgi:hypothetical protein
MAGLGACRNRRSEDEAGMPAHFEWETGMTAGFEDEISLVASTCSVDGDSVSLRR